MQLIELESKKENIIFKQKSGKESLKELKMRQETIKSETKQLEQNIEKLTLKISDEEKLLEKHNSQIQKKRSILDLKQRNHRDTYNEIDDIQQKIAREQENKELILEDLKSTELEMVRIQQMIKLIEEKIMDKYRQKIPKELIIDDSEEELELKIQKFNEARQNRTCKYGCARRI